jgi:hypothetical protein
MTEPGDQSRAAAATSHWPRGAQTTTKD